MSKTFNRIGIPKVGRSLFNLSYEKKFTGGMGKLYPVQVDEVVPGDVFDMAASVVIRMAPLVTPILHEVNVYMHTFFVPYRLLMTEELGDDGDFEDMIIGGSDGDTDITIPTWEPTTYTRGSLWDYMGFPVGVDPAGAYPVDFPKRAYNFIWNEYYRDQELISEVDITTYELILPSCWEKDYFTSARPYQQRGTAPALPVAIVGEDSDIKFTSEAAEGPWNMQFSNAGQDAFRLSATPTTSSDARWSDPALASVTFDVSDMRLIFQVQKWMERNERAGTRYTEFLKSHFGVSVRDDRLDRPEYIGGLKMPMIISEVLQTESSDASTAQGTMTGHGISAGVQRIGRYRVKEFGLIMTLLKVMPRTLYSQGIDRQWRKDTLYDFYFPEFANLSEQPVLTSEIYATAVEATNDTVFGYQGRYNEMRVKKNIACGHFGYGGDFDYWHLGRQFGSTPTLNDTFLQTNASASNGGIRLDPFAVESSHHLFISVGNIIKAARPMPVLAMPGLIDHQ